MRMSLYARAQMRLAIGLDVGIKALRNKDEGGDFAGLHVRARQVQVVIINDLAQLGGVQLRSEGARCGALVFIDQADGKVVRKTVLHEGQVKHRIHQQHPQRGEDVHRPFPDNEQFPPDNVVDGSHFSSRVRITLMPGRRPST